MVDLHVLPNVGRHGRVPAEPIRVERAREPRVAPAQGLDGVPAHGASLADAKKVLLKLKLRAREADELIRKAGPCATTEELVRKALELRPVSA